MAGSGSKRSISSNGKERRKIGITRRVQGRSKEVQGCRARRLQKKRRAGKEGRPERGTAGGRCPDKEDRVRRPKGRRGLLPAGRAGPSPRPPPRCRLRPCRRWPRARSPRSRGCAPPGGGRGRCRGGPSAGGRRPRRPAPRCAGSSAAPARPRPRHRHTGARPAPAPRGAAAASSRRVPGRGVRGCCVCVSVRACVSVCVWGEGGPGAPVTPPPLRAAPRRPRRGSAPSAALCSLPPRPGPGGRPRSPAPPVGPGRAGPDPAAPGAPAVRSPRGLLAEMLGVRVSRPKSS